jgi:SAM-dependent methyltransferase
MRSLARAFRRLVTDYVPEGGGARVVDFGCGTRPYEPLFERRKTQYIGVDIGPNPQADLVMKPGERVPLEDGAADVVVSSQVLEHVVDVEGYLAECRRLLKPGGMLLLSTHGTWLYHPYPTDVRRWTCWGLRHDIGKIGFRIEAQHGCVGPLAYTTQVRLQMVRGALYQLGSITSPLIGLFSIGAQLMMMLEDSITPGSVREENSAIYAIGARRL